MTSSRDERAAHPRAPLWALACLAAACTSETSEEPALATVYCAVASEEGLRLDETSPHGAADGLVAALLAVGPLQMDLHGLGPVPASVEVQDALALGFDAQDAALMDFTGLPGPHAPAGTGCPTGLVVRVDGVLTAEGTQGFLAEGPASIHFPTPDPLDAWLNQMEGMPMAWEAPEGGVFAEILADHSCLGDPWTGLYAAFYSGTDVTAPLDGRKLRDGWAVGLNGTCDNPDFQRTAAVMSGVATPAP